MTSITERVPPNDLAAEAAVIGAVLLDNTVLARVLGVVTADDFYAARHRIIWGHMQEIAARGMAIDHVTVAASLREAGDIDRIGGLPTLAGLTDGVATSVNAESYATIVRNMSTARRIVHAAQSTCSSR
jgi:replicative DNA helicase